MYRVPLDPFQVLLLLCFILTIKLNFMLVLSPFTDEETGTEKLGSQPKVAELVSGEARTKIKAL